MNKRKMADLLAERLDMSYRDGYTLFSVVLDMIEEELRAGRPVPLAGIGILEPVERKSYEAHNPRAPHVKVQVPERTVVRFRQSRALRAKMNRAPEDDA